MILSKEDPDYVFQEYKGHIIASHINNVSGKSINNLILVYSSEDFPNFGFIVGLDDSKSSGNRKSLPNSLEDAKDYIDWKIELTEKQDLQGPINHIDKKRNEILSLPEYDYRVNKGILPTIDIAGHLFYVDMRMDKLRPKDDFLSGGISFQDIDDHFSEERNAYLITYDPKKHEFRDLDYENLLSVPKDLIAIEFPFQQNLDPIGWNRQNGWDILDDVKPKDLIPHFKAKIVPWEQTYIFDIIRDNKELLRKQEKEKPKPQIKKGKGRKM